MALSLISFKQIKVSLFCVGNKLWLLEFFQSEERGRKKEEGMFQKGRRKNCYARMQSPTCRKHTNEALNLEENSGIEVEN